MKKAKKTKNGSLPGLVFLCLIAAAVMILALVYHRMGDRPISSGAPAFHEVGQRVLDTLGLGGKEEDEEAETAVEVDADALRAGAVAQAFPGWRELSAGEYRAAYSYPLAEPEGLPEGFAADESVFVRDEEKDVSLGRLWMDAAGQRVLLLRQFREERYQNKLEYPGGEVDFGENNGAVPGSLLNTCARWEFAVGGWRVEPMLLLCDGGSQRYDCEQILRSVTLSGQGSEEVYRQQSIASDTGSLGDYSYELRLLEEEEDARYWSALEEDRVSRVEHEDRVRLRIRFFDREGSLRQQYDYPVPELPAFVAVAGTVRDLNGDGGRDLMVSSAGRLFGFVYEPRLRGFQQIKDLGGRTDLGFDAATSLLRHKSEGDVTVYDLYEVKGNELSMIARLSIDFREPIESRFTEYEVIGDQFFPVAENVGSDLIDHEKWNFVDVWE